MKGARRPADHGQTYDEATSNGLVCSTQEPGESAPLNAAAWIPRTRRVRGEDPQPSTAWATPTDRRGT